MELVIAISVVFLALHIGASYWQAYQRRKELERKQLQPPKKPILEEEAQ